MKNKVSIVIPVYNEERRIRGVLENYGNSFPNYEIVVVCNGCTDNSLNIVKELKKKYSQINILNFEKKLGKGGAVLEGFKFCKGEIIGFVDADDSIEPEEIKKLLILLEKVDVIIGSRWLRDSEIIVKQSLLRRVASRIFNFLVRKIFNLSFKDTQCGVKFFRREAIENVLKKIKSKGYEFDVEILWRLKNRNYKIREVPISWKHSKDSRFSLWNSPIMFISLLKIRFSL
jgi:glycosyltransferase involved in cell wall biosynthesis